MKRRPPISGCPLTIRQLVVVKTSVKLKTTASNRIAEELVVSPYTVRRHWQDICDALGAHSRSEVMMIVTEQGWHRE